MECKFYVGQKVVCVDIGSRNRFGIPENLVLGSIYTVTRVALDIKHKPSVFVAEAEPNKDAFGFAYERFRPATDISIFHELVEKVKKGNRELVKDHA